MKRRQRYLFKFLFIIVGFLVVFYFIKALRSSVIFKDKQRLNIVFYEDSGRFYSIDRDSQINYYLCLYPDLKVVVPGGYGQYRLGALSKLAGLEKKPDLIEKTFSQITSSFVDLYFFKSQETVYFGKEQEKKVVLPTISQIFTMKSNGNFFDRVFLATVFLGKNKLKFNHIRTFPVDKDEVFLAEEFAKRYQGYFYEKAYRNENLNVQLVYTKNYKTANLMTRIIEGAGIRVADLTQDPKAEKKCQIWQNKDISKSAAQLALFFDCQIFFGQTEPYDIIFNINSQLEEEWLIED